MHKLVKAGRYVHSKTLLTVGLAVMIATAFAVPSFATEPEHVINASTIGTEAKAEFVYILGGVLIVIVAVILGNLAVKTLRKHVK